MISTSPSGRAVPGATIVLTVSAGPKMIIIPPVPRATRPRGHRGAAQGGADRQRQPQKVGARATRHRLGRGHHAGRGHLLAGEQAGLRGRRRGLALPNLVGQDIDSIQAWAGPTASPSTSCKSTAPAAGHHRAPVHPRRARRCSRADDGHRLRLERAAEVPSRTCTARTFDQVQQELQQLGFQVDGRHSASGTRCSARRPPGQAPAGSDDHRVLRRVLARVPLIGSHATVTGGLATGGARSTPQRSRPRSSRSSCPTRAAGRHARATRRRTRVLRDVRHPGVHPRAVPGQRRVGRPGRPRKSADAVAFALRRGAETGARGVVVHTGSGGRLVPPAPPGTALRQVGRAAPPAAGRARRRRPGPAARADGRAGPDALRAGGRPGPYLDALEHHPKAGVCVDTCHMFAAGHDLTAPAEWPPCSPSVDAAAGPGRVKLVHANDSLLGCGSRRDRHEAIGKGAIGAEPFRALLAHPALAGVAVRGGDSGRQGSHARDITPGLIATAEGTPRRPIASAVKERQESQRRETLPDGLTRDARERRVHDGCGDGRGRDRRRRRQCGRAWCARRAARRSSAAACPARSSGSSVTSTGSPPRSTWPSLPGVADVVRISVPYKLVSREHRQGALGHPGRRGADRAGHAHRHRRAVRRGDPGADAGGRPDGPGGRRVAAARRRVQAAQLLAVRVPGPRRGGAADPGRRPRGDRPADRHRGDRPARRRPGRFLRRHAAGRHPQHAELPAAAGGRRLRASRSCSSAA